MKPITLPPLKVGKNQVLLPSGVVQSKDGKYHYWQCSVSGLMTFAKPDYWVKIMAKYGSEENLVKTYVCQKAKRLLDEGVSQADIIQTLSHPETAEAKKARKEAKKIKKERKAVTKKVRKASLKSFAVGAIDVAVTNDTGSVEVQKVPVYPWQGNPDYFRSAATPLSIEEATRDTCIYPNRHLDDECRGCPVYDRCVCPTKFTPADWKKGKKRPEAVVTPLNSFE